jgi:hypothetical protein
LIDSTLRSDGIRRNGREQSGMEVSRLYDVRERQSRRE